MALLRGEMDVNQYWCESGEQQVKSAGVRLAQQQQERALKNLARLRARLAESGFALLPGDTAPSSDDTKGVVQELRQAFDKHLATYR